MSKITLTDWTLGITDDIVDADPRSAKRMDNLLLNRQGKPCQRPGLVFLSENNPQIPAGNQRIDSIFFYDGTVFVKSSTKLYYKEAGANWVELSTSSSKAAFGDSVLGAGVSWSVWRGHVFATPMPYLGALGGCRTIKIYRTTTAPYPWTCEQAGVPSTKQASYAGTSIGTASSGQEHSYIMAIVFRHKHSAMVDGVATDFVNYGAPFITGIRMEEPDDSVPVDITFENLSWTNGSLDNYRDASVGASYLIAEGFRTKSDDSVLYFSIAEDQSTDLVFDLTDDEIGGPAAENSGYDDFSAPEFYMNGGVKENGPIPHCLYSLVMDGYGFYGAYTDPYSSIQYQNRLVQSNPAQPEGVYTGNFVEFAGSMTGLARVGSYPIIISTQGALRVEGRFDGFGGGGMKVFNIPDSEPGIAGKGVVQLDGAIIYQSASGWTWTNGFQSANISKHLRQTYASFENKENMAAVYDRSNQLVLLAVEDPEIDEVVGKNNRIYVVDMKHSQPDRGVFTTWSFDTYCQPNALGYDSSLGKVLVGDSRGYLFTFDQESYGDIKATTTLAQTYWPKVGIVWDLITPAFAAGEQELDKFWTKIYGTFKRLTGYLSAQFSTFKNRDETVEHTGKAITHRARTGIHSVERWVPGGRWATFQQLRVKKALVAVTNSDSLGTAHVETSADTVELLSGYWPLLDGDVPMTGYFIYFDFDNYETGFEIYVQAGNVLTVLDPNNFLVQSAEAEWVIMGYPKDEGVEITSLSLEYEDEGDPVNEYRSGEDGANS